MMETAGDIPLATGNTDALSILRQQLQEVSQRFARGVSNHLPMDQLESLRNEASHIANCIKYLLEVQKYCDPPKVETTQQSVNQSSNRFDDFIPNDLPTWQWVGNVWRMDVKDHDSVEDLLDTFALIVSSNGLAIDQHWMRLVPIKMNRDQKSWFNEVLKGRSLNWDEARSITVNTYATQDVAQTLNNIDQLLTIKMQQNESIKAFPDRCQRIRRAAKWQDDIRTAALFKRALPVALYKEVSCSLLNLPLNQQDSVCKVSAKVHTVISSNICNDETMAAGVTKRNITTQSSANPISFVSGADKSMHNPKNASGPSKANLNSSLSQNVLFMVMKNCFKCSVNVPWSPDHAATCSRDKVKRFNGPTKAFRSARFSGPHNRSKHLPAAVNLNDQEHSHGSMDIDLSSLPTNYDYIAFANKNNININNNVSGSIVFATNDNKSKHFGTTSKALSLIYGDNDDTLIHTSHIFEVLPLSFDTDAVIGLDLMPKLNILITNLAVKHPNKKPAAKEEIDDTPEPNNAPYGTTGQ
ncbi:hypothetical protein RO3G_04662 [Rhizopus delemar RA 99-880]|uniref:Retrotransposon gag domain-containing protein n=1 Tax=Rhizopus delemar (strain RA 99-880 / ATCC MYA-4621 / FGSC 9543 / NRRL 43880) TaxID=246409 RepID=I1BUS7_RHIO9|nr:hypothetical protein RO3G_04662 [Rhizopus delemar RA 99-880]|eukprot:EIE79957.1 hypothetical protein RO3G_04662 [Rhizopus delemar RA 99-880]